MGVNALRHGLLDFEHRHLNGVGERQRVSPAVALDDDALQAQQTGAVVAARVNSAAEGAQYRQGNQAGQPGQWITFELAA